MSDAWIDRWRQMIDEYADAVEGDRELAIWMVADQAVTELMAAHVTIDRLTTERPKAERDFEDQRAQGWPDFHPEDFCHRCGRPNISWWTDSDLFNEAIGQPDGIDPEWRGIICPPCFVELSPLDTSWQLLPRERAAELASASPVLEAALEWVEADRADDAAIEFGDGPQIRDSAARLDRAGVALRALFPEAPAAERSDDGAWVITVSAGEPLEVGELGVEAEELR